MYNFWGVPLRISFPYQDDSNIYSWLVTDYVADAIYLIDTLLVRPRLRFVHEGSWVEDVKECRKNYIIGLSFKVLCRILDKFGTNIFSLNSCLFASNLD